VQHVWFAEANRSTPLQHPEDFRETLLDIKVMKDRDTDDGIKSIFGKTHVIGIFGKEAHVSSGNLVPRQFQEIRRNVDGCDPGTRLGKFPRKIPGAATEFEDFHPRRKAS